jgi:hypothetical protein
MDIAEYNIFLHPDYKSHNTSSYIFQLTFGYFFSIILLSLSQRNVIASGARQSKDFYVSLCGELSRRSAYHVSRRIRQLANWRAKQSAFLIRQNILHILRE